MPHELTKVRLALWLFKPRFSILTLVCALVGALVGKVIGHLL